MVVRHRCNELVVGDERAPEPRPVRCPVAHLKLCRHARRAPLAQRQVLPFFEARACLPVLPELNFVVAPFGMLGELNCASYNGALEGVGEAYVGLVPAQRS